MEEVEILAVVPKHEGVDTVVRVLQAGAHRFLDVRDRVQVDGEAVWGRGYLIPLARPSLATDIAEALQLGAEYVDRGSRG